MVSTNTRLSLVFSHLAHFTTEAHIDCDMFSETASNCLLNILFSRPGDSCSLAESWRVTGPVPVRAVLCSTGHSTQYRRQVPTSADIMTGDQSLV